MLSVAITSVLIAAAPGEVHVPVEVRDTVVVDDDGEVEVTREMRGPDLESFCDHEASAFDDCDFEPGKVTLEASFDRAPWAQKRGNLDSDYVFDARGYWQAFPVGVPRSESTHTVRLSMPGTWVHRFGCLAPAELPAQLTFRGEGTRPRCTEMPPKRKGMYRYDRGAFVYEYRERPRHLLVSHESNPSRMFATMFVVIALVALVLAARLVNFRRLADAIWRR